MILVGVFDVAVAGVEVELEVLLFGFWLFEVFGVLYGDGVDRLVID